MIQKATFSLCLSCSLTLLPYLCHDESFLKVGVDLSGSLGGLGPLLQVTMERENKAEEIKGRTGKVTHNDIYKSWDSNAHANSWRSQAPI